MTERTKTTHIAIHISDTSPGMDIGEDEIRQWHLERGWSDIGYNAVIRLDGRIEIGRPLDHRGAHVKGFNDCALGIVIVGRDEQDITFEQWGSLRMALRFFELVYPGCEIWGHCDFPGVTKTCPNFNVKAWLSGENLCRITS